MVVITVDVVIGKEVKAEVSPVADCDAPPDDPNSKGM